MSLALSRDEALRHECLKLAVSADRGVEPVDDARRFYAFIRGESEKTPRERIIQVMEDAGVT